jgi:hypothetical protein
LDYLPRGGRGGFKGFGGSASQANYLTGTRKCSVCQDFKDKSDFNKEEAAKPASRRVCLKCSGGALPKDLSQCLVKDLKQDLSKRGLATTGLKAALVRGLQSAVKGEAPAMPTPSTPAAKVAKKKEKTEKKERRKEKNERRKEKKEKKEKGKKRKSNVTQLKPQSKRSAAGLAGPASKLPLKKMKVCVTEKKDAGGDKSDSDSDKRAAFIQKCRF